MPEIAIATPFDSNEVKDIAVQEFRRRLDGLSPLTGGKEFAAFTLDFEVKIRLLRAGEPKTEAKETLAWGTAGKGELPSGADLDAAAEEMETAAVTSSFESRDPNEERQARDMPLTVETSDGRGGKIRKKVRVRS